MTESARVILASSDRVFERELDIDRGVEVEGRQTERWSMSPPVPGVLILNVWEIYHRMKLMMIKTETGHYQLLRSINGRNYTLVHDHATEIFNVFYIDEGVAAFSATDGWWITTTTGRTWDVLNEGPPSKSATVIWTNEEGEWVIIAVGNDRKIYRIEYPGGAWEEVFDTRPIWAGKWYPTIVGSPISIVVGAGPHIIRSGNLGDDWENVHTLPESEVVKSITAASHSNMPVHLIETDIDGEYRFYLSHDDCDTLQLNQTRYNSVASVAAVIPTNQSVERSMFAILGRRTPESALSYKIINEEGVQ